MATLEKVRQEAQLLRERLIQSDNSLARTRKIKLELEAPELVRAFWEIVPFSKGCYEIASPDIVSSRKIVEKTLKLWQRTSRGYNLTIEDLPQPFRLVYCLPQQGMLLTDESGGDADPPVVTLAAPDGPVDMPLETAPYHPSYLDYVTTSLAAYTLRSFHSTTLELAAMPALEQPLPTLAPQVYRANEHVWLMPRRAGAAAPRITVRFNQMEAFIRLVDEHRSLIQAFPTGQSGVYFSVCGLKPEILILARSIQITVYNWPNMEGNMKHQFGWLEDRIPVWIEPAGTHGTSYYPDLVGITTDRAHREELAMWIRKHELKLVAEGEA